MVLGLLAITACTSSDSSDSSEPSSRATVGPDPEALVRSGVRALRRANSGRMRILADDGRRETETIGVYRIKERAHRSEVTKRAGDDTARRISILRKGLLYTELTDSPGTADPGTTCWAVGRARGLERFDGAFDIADAKDLPPALLAVGTAVGETVLQETSGDVAGAGTQISGTLDLFYVLNAFGSDEAGDLDLVPGKHRVMATLRLENKTLRGFTVTGEDLSEATLRAGTLLGAYPAEARVEVEFSDAGQVVDLGLPPENRRFAVSNDLGLRGLRDCLVQRSDARESAPIGFRAPVGRADPNRRFSSLVALQPVMMGS